MNFAAAASSSALKTTSVGQVTQPSATVISPHFARRRYGWFPPSCLRYRSKRTTTGCATDLCRDGVPSTQLRFKNLRKIIQRCVNSDFRTIQEQRLTTTFPRCVSSCHHTQHVKPNIITSNLQKQLDIVQSHEGCCVALQAAFGEFELGTEFLTLLPTYTPWVQWRDEHIGVLHVPWRAIWHACWLVHPIQNVRDSFHREGSLQCSVVVKIAVVGHQHYRIMNRGGRKSLVPRGAATFTHVLV